MSSSSALVAPAMVWRAGPYVVDLSRPRVMGIVNLTPDSFSDGGLHVDANAALAHVERLVADGADMLDLGAESTRPGAAPLPRDVELARLMPVLRVAVTLGIPVSVDTYKPDVMQLAIDAGASIVNDIRALREPGALDVVAASQAGVCLMHMQGEPRSMQHAPRYGDVVAEVRDFLIDRANALRARGVDPTRIAIDPGFGFGKTAEHNLALLQATSAFVATGYVALVGVSRKSMIAHWTGRPTSLPRDRVAGSLAAALFAVERGARIVRVHDVRQTVEALHLWWAAQGR